MKFISQLKLYVNCVYNITYSHLCKWILLPTFLLTHSGSFENIIEIIVILRSSTKPCETNLTWHFNIIFMLTFFIRICMYFIDIYQIFILWELTLDAIDIGWFRLIHFYVFRYASRLENLTGKQQKSITVHCLLNELDCE